MRQIDKKVILLNPSEKGAKYAEELRTKQRLTNGWELKGPKGLTPTQAAFRMGYLNAHKDSANCYKALKKKKKK